MKCQQRALGARARSAPRLISRVWLEGPSDAGTTPSRTVNQAVPAGATWVDARGIGSGGGSDSLNGTNGGGGAYARGGSAVSPGGVVNCVVPGQSGTAVDGVDASASVNGVTFMKAAAGKRGNVSAGLGGTRANCIGTTIVPGGDAGTNGGQAGGDAADKDSLRIGGNFRRNGGSTRVTDGSAQAYPNDYGCGGTVVDTYVPATPVDTNFTNRLASYGGLGVVVLEFWTRKPN